MKDKRNKNIARIKRGIFFLSLPLFITMCVLLDSIEYESSVVAGEEATFIMNARIEPNAESIDTRLVIGYLVPKSWKASENTTVTYTNNLDEGVQEMSLIPEDEFPVNGEGLNWPAHLKSREGVGPNVLDGMEWVVFWSNKTYSVIAGEHFNLTITIKTIVGMDNLKAKLGFFINHSNDGLSTDDTHFKFMYTDCFEVTDGEGDMINFCELQFNAVEPLQNTKDDIITFKFQGDVDENELIGASSVYFSSIAYSNEGNMYDMTERIGQTQMKKENAYGSLYSISFWPAGYYIIPDEETLEKIEYIFINEDGSAEVTNYSADSTAIPFRYTFRCK